MNVNDVFPSKWLKASELVGKEVKVKIESVGFELMKDDDPESGKIILHFVGKKKGVSLNKTNSQTLAATFSPETDGWVGKEIVLFSQKVNFAGNLVDGIKVRPFVAMVDGTEKDEDEPPF